MNYSFLSTYLSLLFLGAWFSILFIQSGLDKITDWKGNLDWLKSHFSKTPFSKSVPQMLGIVAISETAAGMLCLIGTLYFAYSYNGMVLFWGFALSLLDFVMLFFGQRIAKDYAGAATLQAYFIAGIIGLLLSGNFSH
jgi:uncharacterized membrane protein YphA (DoxX/SURF4 family)